MSDTIESFDDLQRPDVVAQRYPHIWPSALSLKRECRRAATNGMQSSGAVIKYKNRTYCHVPKLLEWFEEHYGRQL